MKEVRFYKSFQYCIWFPETYQEGEKYPVVFHMHGAGSRGRDISLIGNGVGNTIAAHMDAIVVSPQCYSDTWFDIFSELIDFCKEIYCQPYTDQSRFYGSGISMGGYGILQLMMSCPALFTAGIVCCGGGMYWNAGRLHDIPVKLFHGKQDGAVCPEESEWMAYHINEIGGHAEFVLYPECDHNCWDNAYGDAETYAFLMRYSKNTNQIK